MSKIAVVTGANKGIGFAIVEQLCKTFNGAVYLTARDETRGQNAVEKLRSMGLNPQFHQLDIANENSIATLKNHLRDLGGLDVLVNNAALTYQADIDALIDPLVPPCQPDGDVTFAEQARKTLLTNYFGTRKLCDALFPLLRPNGRVVNLSSDSGHLSRIAGKEPNAAVLKSKFASDKLTYQELDKLMMDFIQEAEKGTHFENGWSNSSYEVSKVGISALTRVQQRELDKAGRSDVAVNSVHPGFVSTDSTKHRGPTPIELGASAAVYLSLLPENIPEELRGGYIWFDKTVVDWVNGPMPPAW